MTNEEAIKKIKKVIEESTIFQDELEAFDMAIKALDERPKGKRKIKYINNCYYYCCSICNEKSIEAGNFCPHCGAEMEVEE